MAALNRFNRIVLEVLGGLLLVSLVSVALLIFRLSSGPISLEWLGPAISSAISDDLDEGVLSLGSVSLFLAPDTNRMTLGLEEIRYEAASGYQLEADQLVLTPDLKSLLIGRFAAGALSINRVIIHANRAPDLGDGGWLLTLRKFIQAGAGQPTNLSLQSLTISEIYLVHPDLSPEANAAPSYVKWVQEADQALVDVRLSYETSARKAEIVVLGDVVRGEPGHIEFSVKGFSPRDIATLAPPLDFLSQQTSPVAIIGTLDIDSAGQPNAVTADLSLGSGAIVIGRRAWPIDRVTAGLLLNLKDRTLLVQDARLRAGGEYIAFSANADYSVDAEGRLRGLSSSVDISEWAWRPNPDNPFVLSGQSLSAVIRVHRPDQRVTIDALKGVVGTIPIELSGVVNMGTPEREAEIDLRAEIGRTELRSALSVWPPDQSVRTRQWIDTNIRAGMVENGWVAFKGPVSEFSQFRQRQLPAETFLSGDLNFSGLTLKYTRTMPPIEQGAGVLHASGHRITVDLSEGVVRVGGKAQSDPQKDQQVSSEESDLDASGTNSSELSDNAEEGSVRIMMIHDGFFKSPPFFEPNGRAEVRLKAEGDLQPIMQTLSEAPVFAMRGLPFAAEDLSGDLVADVALSVPLRREKGAPLSVGYDVTAVTKNVDVTRPIERYRISKGNLTVHVTPERIAFDGPLQINEVPFLVSGTRAGKESGTQIKISGEVSSEITEKLNVGFLSDHFSGAAGLDLTLTLNPDGGREINFKVDGSPLDIAPKFLSYQKPAGRNAEIIGRLTASQDRQIEKIDVAYRSQEDAVIISVKSPNGIIDHIEVPEFHLGESYNLVVNSQMAEHALVLKLKSDQFNMSRILYRGGVEASGEGDPVLALPKWPQNVEFDLRATNVVGAQEITLPVVHISGFRSNDLIEKMITSANFIDGQELYGEVFRDSETTRRFLLQTENVDHLLRGIGLSEALEGGALSLSGTLYDTPIEEDGAIRSFDGSYAVSPFTVRKVPVLAQLLSLASLSGLNNTLTGKGIRFTNAKGNFRYYNQRLDLTDGLLTGPSLGISVQGAIDRKVRRLSLGGTLVPAYGLNSALGKIPILGRLLAGREGEGVVGVSYRIFGATDAPSVLVNPLSVFTPGFVRQLFELGTGNISR